MLKQKHNCRTTEKKEVKGPGVEFIDGLSVLDIKNKVLIHRQMILSLTNSMFRRLDIPSSLTGRSLWSLFLGGVFWGILE